MICLPVGATYAVRAALLVTTALPLLATSAVLAQTALPPITVEASQESSLTVPNAVEAAERLRRVPGNVSVVPAETFRDAAVTGLHDALALTPGVYVQSRNGSEGARFSIRGSGISAPFGNRGVRLMRDGLPLTRADGYVDGSYADPFNADYIEVLRGANALEFGATTLGGVINLVSPTGYSKPGLETRLELGSDGYMRSQARFGQVFDEGLDVFASIGRFDTDGFRDNSEQEISRFYGNVGYRFSPASEGRFHLNIERQILESPGAITLDQLRSNPSVANPGAVRSNASLDMTPRVHASYQHKFLLGDGDQLSLGGYYTNTDFENPGGFANFFYNDTDYGLSLRHEMNRDIGGHQNRFIWGASWTEGFSKNDTFGPVFFGSFLAEPNPGQFEKTRNDRRNYELMLENSFHVTPAFAVVAGGQAIWARRETRNSVPTPPTFFPIFFPADASEDYNSFNPKVGAIWSPRHDVQFYGNLSRSFEPPTSFEFDNGPGGNLKAQHAETIEIGTRGGSTPFGWSVAAYHSLVHDELLSVEFPLNSGQFSTGNIDRSTHSGIEIGLNGRFGLPVGHVDWDAAYTWNRFRFDDDSTFGDNELPGVPEHFGRLALTWHHLSGFHAGPRLDLASSRYVDLANTLEAPSYGVLHLGGGYAPPSANYRLFVDVRNVTDERYVAVTEYVVDAGGADQSAFNPGLTRTLYFGVAVNW